MIKRNKNNPPALFEWLLKTVSNREVDFSISGDFEEIFQKYKDVIRTEEVKECVQELVERRKKYFEE